MQLSFSQKEQFFHELCQLARSGIPLPGALEMLGRSRRKAGRVARQLLEDLKATSSVSQAFLSAGFAASDGAVIEAGESSGHLDQVFEELETYYHQLKEARNSIVSRSLYAVVVLHLGAFLLALPSAVSSGKISVFFEKSLPVLLIFYGLLFAAFLAWRVLRGLMAGSVGGTRLVTSIPVVGNFLSNLTAWRFSLVLSLYVRAGGGMLKGFNLAGASCGSGALESASAKAVSRVQNGETLTSAFCVQPGLPEILERSIEVGERSGRLDEETRRAAEIFKKRTLGILDKTAEWLPKIVYIMVVLYTGYQAVMMMKDYYSNMSSMMDNLGQLVALFVSQ